MMASEKKHGHYELVMKHCVPKIQKWKEKKARASKGSTTLLEMFPSTGVMKSATSTYKDKMKKLRRQEQRLNGEFTPKEKARSNLAFAAWVASNDVPLNAAEQPAFKEWQNASVGGGDDNSLKCKRIPAPGSKTTKKFVGIVCETTHQKMSRDIAQVAVKNVLPSGHLCFDLVKNKKKNNEVC